jgi:hypothetical protein
MGGMGAGALLAISPAVADCSSTGKRYIGSMTTKEQVLDLVRHLPDDVSVDEIMVCLRAIPAVIDADRSIDDGHGRPHDAVMDRLRSQLR